jgi:ferredoxin-type protein NapH
MDRYNDSIRALVNAPLLSTLYYKSKEGKFRLTLRAWRWLIVIVINLLFFLSFHIDLQLLEGTLNGSRLFGFHLIDPFTALEIFAAEHHFHINVIIGSVTLIVFYLLVGGKAYCALACAYGVLSEMGERINQILVR